MRRSRKIIFLMIAIFSAVGLTGFSINFYFGIDDAYAQWGAADMVIAYMESHAGQWPQNWETLEPAFNNGSGRVSEWSFDKYKSRIYIDFHANASQLQILSLCSDSVPFDVIHANWTWGVHFEGGPNAMLYEHFLQKKQPECAE